MDRSGTQHYYIATSQSPIDDRARVLKYGRTFLVFDRLGDVQTTGMGEQGLFFEDTRHLSELVVLLWGTRPLLLSSTVETSNFLFTGDLANLDVSRNNEVVVPRGTLHVLRSRFLWNNTCFEEIEFVNHGLSELVVPFRTTFDADFADIFEVRGMHRPRKGKHLPSEMGDNSVLLSYEGLDHTIRRTRIQWDGAPHHSTERELDYEVRLRPKERASFRLSISCDSNAKVQANGYSRAMAAAREELDRVGASFPRMYSSNSRFNDWINRSVSDVQMMVVGNPEKDYPYAGVPWFGTVFGRDGIITALQALWLNPEIARGVLECLASTQADHVDETSEAEPGKILHEMRCGEMAVLGEVPFGRYYGSVDATPLFVHLANAYYERTGDRDLVEEIWPNIEAALLWMHRYGDRDGDGFIEYSRQPDDGLVHQGWKDSDDAIFHADGSLARGPIAGCEVQSYAYAAWRAGAALAAALGHTEQSTDFYGRAETLQARFDSAFWCDDLGTYALALDGDKRPCRVRTSNAGQCLAYGIVPSERAARLAQTLLAPASFSGWGIRSVATSEPRYNPMGYHNGGVWPHDNALIACGLARYGRVEEASRIFTGLFDTAMYLGLHRVPELFCGFPRDPGEGPILYPVACAPQAWSAASVFLLFQASLGLTIDGIASKISFVRPWLPPFLNEAKILNLQVADANVDLAVVRHEHDVSVKVLRRSGEVEIVVVM